MIHKLSISSLLIFIFLMTSCIDYDEASRLIDIKVQLQMPAEFTKGSDLEGHDIRLAVGSSTLTAKTDANGQALFKAIAPDIYSISTSWEITNEQYMSLTGIPAQSNGCTVSGSLNSQLLSEAQEQSPILLPTNVAVKRDIVISKIASAGSKDKNNRSYRAGKYLELYNQSNDSIIISGLYIGLLDSSNPQPYTLENLHADFADSLVLVKQVFQIPTDKTYKVAPGASILITNSATDHSDVDSLEHDLRDADFESKDATGTMVNNPNTPALLTTYSTFSKDATMNLVQGGPCGVIIFRTSEDISTWKTTYGYGKTSGSMMYLLVPKRVITDGVDYIKNKKSGTSIDTSGKRLFDDIDAGYTHIESASGWTGEVVYRRTATKTSDGRKILMDTNNSKDDFVVSTTIKPREYDE